MNTLKSLSHTVWDCKLCAAAHNLHDVLSVIMCRRQYNLLFLR